MLAAYQAYEDLMDWSSFKNLTKDAALFVTGPVGGIILADLLDVELSHVWKKISVEIADSVLTIGRDTASGVPPHIAIATEAVSQVGDVLFRAALGQSKNPSWADSGPRQIGVGRSGDEVRELIEAMTKARIRGALERLRGRVKAALKGEDFRQVLAQRYQGETLAIALTQATVTRNTPPRLEGLKQWNPGGAILDSTFNFFTQPSGALKTLLKTRFLEGEPGDAPTPFKDIGLDLLQSSVRDMVLGGLERERLEVLYAAHAADLELQMISAHNINEFLLQRIDERIQKILVEQIIPELTAEVERLRASRELDIVRNAEVEDEQATLVMTFSNEVDIERVTLADVALAPKQKRDTWQAEIDLDKFEDADAAQLTVVARPPAFEERQLDDPKTVASWSTQTSSFNAYEQKPDTYHKIRLKPEEIAGEITYYPRCIMVLAHDERHLISAENERHLIAEMEKISAQIEKISRGGDMTELLLGGLRRRSLSTIASTLLAEEDGNSEYELVLGKKKRYFYTFPVVRFWGDNNRLFCIPGQPCYLEKDGGFYSEDNEWLKLAAETHSKRIIEFIKDFDEMVEMSYQDESYATRVEGVTPRLTWGPLSYPALASTESSNAGAYNSCEWWAPNVDGLVDVWGDDP